MATITTRERERHDLSLAQHVALHRLGRMRRATCGRATLCLFALRHWVRAVNEAAAVRRHTVRVLIRRRTWGLLCAGFMAFSRIGILHNQQFARMLTLSSKLWRQRARRHILSWRRLVCGKPHRALCTVQIACSGGVAACLLQYPAAC
jgi:hypothetical protein